MPKRRNQHAKPLLISFEGVDGAGKSTQIRMLARRLRALRHRVEVLREPGGTRIGEKIRHLLQYDRRAARMTPITETLLFCASRAQLTAEKILPALASGRTVLTDRFFDSTTVYQGYGRKLGAAVMQQLHEFCVGRCRPDLTFVLMMKPEASVKRARKTSRRYDRMESQKKSFYRSIHRGYRALCRLEPRRMKWIRADRSREEVHADIWRATQRKLN
jgi:dTMP kinase